MTVTTDDFVQARWFYAGRARKVRLGVLHATQSPERAHAARGVANDFATRPAKNKASAHVVVDDAETIECVKPGDTAFAVPSANADGWHIEQVGYSEQQLLDWQDPYSQKVIARAARAAREASAPDVFDLPLVWLDVAEVARGDRGWTDHVTCSKALGGSHWDPGPDYPRDQFMQLLTGGAPAPTPIQEDKVLHLIQGEKKPEWFVTDMVTKRHVATVDEANRVIFRTVEAGGTITRRPDNGPNIWPQDDVDRIPVAG